VKTLTCEALGGACDQKLSADTWDEMVKVMATHVMERHPAVTQQMKAMHERDPQEWARMAKPKWDAAPDA
jgi:predicted small metal-binding protein